MKDILLAKQKLPDGWIDCSVGEAHIVREALFKTFSLKESHLVHLRQDKKAEYPSPNGYEPLVKLLEDKYQAPVVITNGAKQALGASFYAFHKTGKRKLGMRTPYWALIPPLAKVHGLEFAKKYDCYLAILPNNPDGFMFDYDYAKYLFDSHKDAGIPVIHDAAYYTPVYLPPTFNFGPLGDMQIFSASKMYGLSGIRIGYVVCYDAEYYNSVLEYMETMTVGVSTPSQDYFYNLLRELDNEPKKTEAFVKESRNELHIARALCKTIRKDILDVPNDITNIPGMFLWAKTKNQDLFKKARIYTVDGKLFGGENMVRINLGLPIETMIEVVDRLNSL